MKESLRGTWERTSTKWKIRLFRLHCVFLRLFLCLRPPPGSWSPSVFFFFCSFMLFVLFNCTTTNTTAVVFLVVFCCYLYPIRRHIFCFLPFISNFFVCLFLCLTQLAVCDRRIILRSISLGWRTGMNPTCITTAFFFQSYGGWGKWTLPGTLLTVPHIPTINPTTFSRIVCIIEIPRIVPGIYLVPGMYFHSYTRRFYAIVFAIQR